MNDTSIVMEHLRAALLATPRENSFLTYLIQMALIEGTSASDDRRVKDVGSSEEVDNKADTYVFPSGARYRTSAYAG